MWLNPFTTLFESYRNVIYNGTSPYWEALAVLAVVSTLLLLAAIAIFKWLEPSFAKVL
jgi:lipopolysaccharide transport system permease protein/teichoic acid transport system permease protein